MSDNTQDRSKAKFDLWERKLLDLSARNTLLNCKLKGKAVPLLVTSCCDIEDKISVKKEKSEKDKDEYLSFDILPRTAAGEIEDKTPKIPEMELEFSKISDTEAIAAILAEGIENKKIFAPLADKELGDRMKNLYRSSRLAFEEDGAGTLFLACGFLKWINEDKKEQYYAPLVLVPVELKRTLGIGRYTLHKTDTDVCINVTLQEKLRQDFDIEVSFENNELPCDASGVDVKQIMERFKEAVSSKTEWEVVDACVLGMFSFSQFVMWNDMHSHREEMGSNDIVKSLLNGQLELPPEDMETAGENFHEENSVLLPISADASQLYAIKCASDGKSFVLHGPPGTGKSQTITALIANAIANGKKVLFVAEKKAALDVVYSRLGKIGIAPFCLELHSNKVSKSYVLDQLKEALESKFKGGTDDYERALKDITSRRAELGTYIDAIKAERSCGYSLYEMLNVYGKELKAPDIILDEGFETDVDKDRIANCRTALRELAVVGNDLSGILVDVKAVDYSQDTKVKLAPELDALEQAMNKLDSAVKAFVAAYPKLGSGEDFATINRLTDSISKYTQARAEMLTDWTPEFLAIDGIAKKGELSAAQSTFALFRSGAVGKVYDSIKTMDKNGVHRNDLGAQLDILSAYQAEYEGYGFDPKSIKIAPVMTDLLAAKDEYAKAYGPVKERLGLVNEALAPDSGTLGYVRDLIVDIRNNENNIRSKTIYNACATHCADLKIANLVTAFSEGTMDEKLLLSAFDKAWSKLLICNTIDSEPVLKSFSGKVFDKKATELNRLTGKFEEITQQEIYIRIARNLPDITAKTAKSSKLAILQHAIKSRGRGVSIRSLMRDIEDVILDITPCVLMSPISVSQFIAPSEEPLFDIVVFDEASQLPTCNAVGVLARGKSAVIVGDPNQMPPTSFFKQQVFDDEDYETEDLESILDDCLAINMPQTRLLWHYRSRHESLITFSNKSFYESKLYTFPSVDDKTPHVTYQKCSGSYDSGKTRTNEAEANLIAEELVRRSRDKEMCDLTYGVVTFNIQQQGLIEDKIDELCREDQEFEKWAFGREEPIFIKNLENVQGDERDVILFSVGYGPDSEGKVSMNFGPLNKDGGWRRLNVAVTRSRCEMKVFSSIDPEQLRVNDSTPEGVKAFKRFLMYASGNANWESDLQNSTVGERRSPLIDKRKEFTGVAEDICARLENQKYTEQKFETDCGVGKSGFKIDIGVRFKENSEKSAEETQKYCLGIIIDGATITDNTTVTSREVSQRKVLEGLGWKVFRIWSIEWWEDPDAVVEQIVNKINEPDPKDKPEDETPEIPITDYSEQLEAEAAEQPAETPEQAEEPEATAETPDEAQKKTESLADVPKVYEAWPCKLKEMTAEEFDDHSNTDLLAQAVKEIIDLEAPISYDVFVNRLCSACGITRKTEVVKKRCEYLVKLTKIHQTAQNLALNPTGETKKVFLWRQAGEEDGILEHFRQPAEGEKPRDAQDITLQEAARAAVYVCKTQYGMSREDLVKHTAYALGFKTSGGWAALLATAGIDYAIHVGELSETPLKIV